MSVAFTCAPRPVTPRNPSFYMSHVAYELLIGDNSMPSAPDGSMPYVIAVETARLMMLLRAAGKYHHGDLPEFLVMYGEGNYYDFDGEKVEELKEDGDALCMLIIDLDYAILMRSQYVYYLVG